jgi:ribosome-binding protein aMBF1 (putative translation factor)
MARRIPLEPSPSKEDIANVERRIKDIRILTGMNLRRFREQKGLSVRQLATRADISPSYLTQVESGSRGATIDFLERLAYFLGTSTESLVSSN